MKITNLLNEADSIEQRLQWYGITNYTINKDGSIDVNGSVDMAYSTVTDASLPFNFRYVSGYFNCSTSHKLTTLKGAPREVGGDFYCYNCHQLVTLQGGPIEVGGDYDCHACNLTDLKGAPREVGGSFYCSGTGLKSLRGSPRYVASHFLCSNNRLTTLQGAPKYVGGGFMCINNEFDKEPDHSFIEIGGNLVWRGSGDQYV